MNRFSLMVVGLSLASLGGCGSPGDAAHQRLLELKAIFEYATVDGARVPTAVHLCGRQFGDSEISELRHLVHLETATLTTDYLTVRGLRALAQLPELRNLSLPALRWTPECANALASFPKLRRLALDSQALTVMQAELAISLPGVEIVAYEEAAPLTMPLRTMRTVSPIPSAK